LITALAVSFVVLFFYFIKGEMGMRTIQSEVIEKGLKQVDRDDLRNGQAK